MRRYLGVLSFGLGGIAILLSLGFWQVQRLAWKEGVLAEIEARIAAPAAPLPEAVGEGEKYRPVALSGATAPGEIFVLVSRKQIGPGYRVIAPFETEDGRRILLDRGFIRLEAKDAARPPLALDIIGNIHLPDDRNPSTPANDVAANLWFARDIPEMAAALATEPLLVVARADTGQGIEAMPVDTAGIPNDHLQYAITWFSLALVWLSMTLYLSWRIRARSL